MTVVLTGGGSGGHITPILAIAAELKRQDSNCQIIYIGQVGDPFGKIPAEDPNIDKVFYIRAGKFRRFHGEGLKQILDLPNLFKNIRDFFYVLIGVIQSWRITDKTKPDIIFSRGGYVSVPVALGGHLNQIPYITHDSDLVPSLANRIIARWATIHAVALPKNLYPYPPEKTITTGIPLSDKFVPVSQDLQAKYKQEIDLPANSKLLFVIGGGLGSQTINVAVISASQHLFRQFEDLYLVHVTGENNKTEVEAEYKNNLSSEEQGRVQVYGYLKDVYRYSGASDIIITRAGATNLAEFAVQGKAIIIIPSDFLVGGHQLKNAEYLASQGAATVINETDLKDDSNRLAKQVSDLIGDQSKRIHLGQELSKFARPTATSEIAKLIMDIGSGNEVEVKKD